MNPYIDIIGRKYPGVWVSTQGDTYGDLVVESGSLILPDQTTLDAAILQDVKDTMTALILTERWRRTSTGAYKVGSSWFHSDDTSRIQQLGLVMMGAGMPAGIMWKTMSGAFVPMTPTLAGQIFQAAAASDMAVFTVAEQKKAAMLASATPETYSYLTGWPLIYGE